MRAGAEIREELKVSGVRPWQRNKWVSGQKDR